MAIESSLFSPKSKKISVAVLLTALTACKSHPSRTEAPSRPTVPSTAPRTADPQVPSTAPAPTREEPVQQAPLPIGVTPKIGLILGPGALRSYAHVGVVQALAKQKMPIHAVAGIEMGALVAAIYANKGQPYDVEWQMMKLKESDLVQKGLLSGQVQAGDVKALNEFMNIALSSNRAENSKVPFACPALQLEKQQVLVMNRGAYTEMLPFCLAFPPLFKPHQQNVAGVLSLKAMVDAVRARGATYVIYVDLLSGPVRLEGAEAGTQILWSLAAENLNRKEKGVDFILRVPLRDYDLMDFNKRREMIQKGQQSAQDSSVQIAKDLNL
ncbi:MAG: patatin-like phospholipase family protein [Pseudobdellovibrionaceae bacterium]